MTHGFERWEFIVGPRIVFTVFQDEKDTKWVLARFITATVYCGLASWIDHERHIENICQLKNENYRKKKRKRKLHDRKKK